MTPIGSDKHEITADHGLGESNPQTLARMLEDGVFTEEELDKRAELDLISRAA